ncbi:hypothetical protein LRS73_24620 [Methylobacterium currus]|nr:hypothetical protein [Methylobacterium currus]UHC15650.1 hypothetical protein LRS73_24620 [Methylobacterium currus]
MGKTSRRSRIKEIGRAATQGLATSSDSPAGPDRLRGRVHGVLEAVRAA